MSACFCTGACRNGGGCGALQQIPGGDGNAKAMVDSIFKDLDFRKGSGDPIKETTNIFTPPKPLRDEAPGFHPLPSMKS